MSQAADTIPSVLVWLVFFQNNLSSYTHHVVVVCVVLGGVEASWMAIAAAIVSNNEENTPQERAVRCMGMSRYTEGIHAPMVHLMRWVI